MFVLRKALERGYADHGWLRTFHSFSFASYHDPRHMGFRSLRVINQDIVAPGAGFPTHGHRDMEIITVVLRGAVQHRDSMGHAGKVSAGEVQRMSAGTGVQHSEANPSDRDELELLQIWIEPQLRGLPPSYEQARPQLKPDALTLIVGPKGDGAPLHLHQDARLYRGQLHAGQELEQRLSQERYGWIQHIQGTMDVNGHMLAAGDGLAISREERLLIRAQSACDFLLFDLA